MATQMTRRSLQNYAPRTQRAVALLIVPGVASFVAILLLASNGGLPLYVSIVIFLGSLVSAKVIEKCKYKTFDCPECHGRLPKPSVVDGQNVTFTCKLCGIEWDTGIYISPGD